ncbi:MAG TPA: pseudouridine synthase, partial [Nitrospiraceae bacterium]|nr:pseudouridine synthase [Nitrospiraceae bacterium]
APAQVKKIRKAESNSWIEITIHEGRTHQVKRMLHAVGHPVLKLVRTRMGSLTLGGMAPGEYRFLTDHEANALRDLVKRRMSAESERGRRPARQQRRGAVRSAVRRTA